MDEWTDGVEMGIKKTKSSINKGQDSWQTNNHPDKLIN